MLLSFIFFIVIIILLIENDNQRSRILKLEIELRNLKENKNGNNNDNYKSTSLVNANNTRGSPNNNFIKNDYNLNSYTKENSKIISKNKYDEKEIKNSAILITGAVLIILASLIFLSSTWGTIHSIIKLLVIILMLFVFAGASYIADNILKIKQTAKVFFYIALSYFPITLFSVSWLGLLGEYLSQNGVGQYIYFTICSVITALIYYIISKKKQSIPLAIASIIFQMVSVILLVFNFTFNLTIVLSALLIYIFIYNNLFLKKHYIANERIDLQISNVLSAAVSIIAISNIGLNLININVDVINIVALILIIINIHYSLNKINKLESIYKLVFPTLIIFTSLVIANLNKLEAILLVKQIIVMTSFSIIIIHDILKDKKLNISSYITILISFIMIYFTSILLPSESICSWIILMIGTLFTIIGMITNREYPDIFPIISSIAVIITITDITISNELPILIILLASIIMFSINLIKNGINSYIKKSTFIVGTISVILSSILVILENKYNVVTCILILLASIIALIYRLKNERYMSKAFSYIGIAISLLILSSIIDFELITPYMIATYTLIIMGIEYIFKELRTKESNYYILISIIISFIALNYNFTIVSFIIIMLLNIILLIYKKYYKLEENAYLISAFSIGLCIYSNKLMLESFNINYLLSILLIATSLLISWHKRNTKEWSIIGYGYILSHTIVFENIKYIPISFLIIATIIYSLVSEKNIRKLFITLIYLFTAILYNMIISDIGLNEYTLFNRGFYLILALLFTRTVVKNENQDHKILEYAFFIMINLDAISGYISELDGILFVSLLVVIMIISYLLKFGPSFICSIIFILLNVILLTREFWVSIPWWIYILLIGSILIIFAVINELNENNKKNLKNKLEEIKNNLDL